VERHSSTCRSIRSVWSRLAASTTFNTKKTKKVRRRYRRARGSSTNACDTYVVDGQAIYKRTYAVSNDRTILVSPLEPGKTYITVLVAGDGIRSETKSDSQLVTTLGKGTFDGHVTHCCHRAIDSFIKNRSRSTRRQFTLVHRSSNGVNSLCHCHYHCLRSHAKQRRHL
jgi:hypothetical protein